MFGIIQPRLRCGDRALSDSWQWNIWQDTLLYTFPYWNISSNFLLINILPDIYRLTDIYRYLQIFTWRSQSSSPHKLPRRLATQTTGCQIRRNKLNNVPGIFSFCNLRNAGHIAFILTAYCMVKKVTYNIDLSFLHSQGYLHVQWVRQCGHKGNKFYCEQNYWQGQLPDPELQNLRTKNYKTVDIQNFILV